MIDYLGAEMSLICEACDEPGESYDRDDFDRMIANAKEDGWLIRIKKGEWTHTCPNCCADFDEVEI